MSTGLSCDYLLVVATDIEERALRDVLWVRFGKKPKCLTTPLTAPERGCATGVPARQRYLEVGDLRRGRVLATRCQMGSDTPGGSAITTALAILGPAPAAVIMVGVAFGVSREAQPIGTVLVSQGIWPYDHRKVGTCSECGNRRWEFRSRKAPAAPRLVAALGHDRPGGGYRLACGWLMSGQTLIDNLEYRDYLLHCAPQDIALVGGEMEGAGLYSACDRFRTDWVLVKGVCDYADGHKHEAKEARQATAAANAAHHVFEYLYA